MSVSASRAAALGERSVVIGLLMMATATQLQPMMDTVAKYLGGQISPLQVAWARMFFQMLFTAPLVIAACGVAGLVPGAMRLQILRGLLMCGANVFFFFGIVVMPLADAIALVFIGPLIVTALSALVLGEQVGPRRWTAVAVGLAGAVIVIRPGFGVFGVEALLPLAAAVCYASYLIVTRQLAGRTHAFQMHFFTAVTGTVVLLAPLALGIGFDIEMLAPSVPTLSQWGLLVLVGLLSTVAHLLIILAYGRAPASVLAPIGYLEIVGAATMGYLVFGDFPDFWTAVGVAVIISSGVYVILRERAKERLPATVAGRGSPPPDLPG